MPAVVYQNQITKAFNIFQELNEKDKEILYKKIKNQILMENAKKIEGFGEPIEMSMEEIVAETKAMRRERRERMNG